MTPEQLLGKIFGEHLRKGDTVNTKLKVVDGPYHQPGSSVMYLRSLESGKRFRLEIKECDS